MPARTSRARRASEIPTAASTPRRARTAPRPHVFTPNADELIAALRIACGLAPVPVPPAPPPTPTPARRPRPRPHERRCA
jgi:hypothetical protein